MHDDRAAGFSAIQFGLDQTSAVRQQPRLWQSGGAPIPHAIRAPDPIQQFVRFPLLDTARVADQRPWNSSGGRGVPAFSALMAEASPPFASSVSNKGMAMLNITSSAAWTPPVAQARSKALWAA